MIVDCDLYIAKMLSDVLVDESFEVSVFNSGITALESLHKEPDIFDCIITDLTLPDMRGDELVHDIRINYLKLPVILMSAEFPPDLSAVLHIFDNIFYLKKPFKIDDFILTVKKSFKKNVEINGDIA